MNNHTFKLNIYLISTFILSSLIIQTILTICICYYDEGNYRNYSSFFNYLYTGAFKHLYDNIGSLILSPFLFLGMLGSFMIFGKIKKINDRPKLRIISSIIASVIAYPILILFVFFVITFLHLLIKMLV